MDTLVNYGKQQINRVSPTNWVFLPSTSQLSFTSSTNQLGHFNHQPTNWDLFCINQPVQFLFSTISELQYTCSKNLEPTKTQWSSVSPVEIFRKNCTGIIPKHPPPQVCLHGREQKKWQPLGKTLRKVKLLVGPTFATFSGLDVKSYMYNHCA